MHAYAVQTRGWYRHVLTCDCDLRRWLDCRQSKPFRLWRASVCLTHLCCPPACLLYVVQSPFHVSAATFLVVLLELMEEQEQQE